MKRSLTNIAVAASLAAGLAVAGLLVAQPATGGIDPHKLTLTADHVDAFTVVPARLTAVSADTAQRTRYFINIWRAGQDVVLKTCTTRACTAVVHPPGGKRLRYTTYWADISRIPRVPLVGAIVLRKVTLSRKDFSCSPGKAC